MAAAMVCRADLIAATRATVDGYADETPGPCSNAVAFQVTCQLAPGFEVAADVCASHQYLIDINIPGTRSIPKRVRTDRPA